jgi:UPF0755 protein
MKLKVFAIVLIILIGGFCFSFYTALTTPAFQNNLIIEIENGDSFNKISNKLVAQGLTINPIWFKLLAYRQNVVNHLKIGEYELTPNLTIPEILTIFAEGRSKKYAVTFPEGWNLKEILEQLYKYQNIKPTLQKVAIEEIAIQLGMQEKHPEGLFFPDTYFFEKNVSDTSILKRAYNKMQSVLAEEWQNKEPNLPYKTPYEALIMASIIEKETGVKSERQLIAGVFTRRLAKGMLLQTDPTVIYGMGDKYNGNIRATDLTTATPYNTYLIHGLPPTPIAMPGREAIHAALHPAKDDNLYFVAKGDGSHQFSKTMADHNHAVNVYQKHKK